MGAHRTSQGDTSPTISVRKTPPGADHGTILTVPYAATASPRVGERHKLDLSFPNHTHISFIILLQTKAFGIFHLPKNVCQAFTGAT